MLGHSKAAGEVREARLTRSRISRALSMWKIYAVKHSVPQHFYLSKCQFTPLKFHLIL